MARQKQLRVNDQITHDPIRLIQFDGQQVGIVPLPEALEAADEVGVDLVEIAPNSDPPVCRLMDYGKYLYNESKRRQDAKKKQKQMAVKEIKFRPGTDVGDYDVKVRKLTEFLNSGNKAKVTMRFRGREMAHKELGIEMLDRVRNDLDPISEVEQHAQMEGRQMVMILTPKR
ncbi:MAG: translation initiation factor IF-3 [Gammaproteobacteria bacterium]|nr:translation initiation factor IF-3 [Gammaproteobacteria bacterium]MCY4226202.1 translation initiation factor IF-3 [Gammaproteobacteria bacterium]MCY4313697.1 translation initiation factor IF-3 [Gammaproteobacteria bacterium]